MAGMGFGSYGSDPMDEEENRRLQAAQKIEDESKRNKDEEDKKRRTAATNAANERNRRETQKVEVSTERGHIPELRPPNASGNKPPQTPEAQAFEREMNDPRPKHTQAQKSKELTQREEALKEEARNIPANLRPPGERPEQQDKAAQKPQQNAVTEHLNSRIVERKTNAQPQTQRPQEIVTDRLKDRIAERKNRGSQDQQADQQKAADLEKVREKQAQDRQNIISDLKAQGPGAIQPTQWKDAEGKTQQGIWKMDGEHLVRENAKTGHQDRWHQDDTSKRVATDKEKAFTNRADKFEKNQADRKERQDEKSMNLVDRLAAKPEGISTKDGRHARLDKENNQVVFKDREGRESREDAESVRQKSQAVLDARKAEEESKKHAQK
ncbi:hypothetical protein [Ensifer aridi]|uniref:hypothetical protein n=1 Tax=Ensifer aridi TaxID=1708715 RepID=UPI000A10A0A2|nr:hypothetical protein [Ensifer aridi]